MERKTKAIDNSADVIDSREIIDRIEYLGEKKTEHESEQGLTWEQASPYEATELKALTALASEASQCAADWEYGEALIRDSYFKEYAQELAEDCGLIPAKLEWPCRCIDWDQAAHELQMDYSAVEFDGVTYWIR